MQPVPSRVPTIRKLASVFPAGGPAGSKKCKKLRISRAEFKTQPSRLLIAPMEPADHEMYRAAIHGDLEAFELVIRNMSRPLFAIAFGALQNGEEAEDVVQDAFVKAWKARWQMRNPEKF